MTGPPGTAACTITLGFFVLRRCGGRAVTSCLHCGRPVCSGHVQPNGVCAECSAAYDAADNLLHPLWPQRLRRRTYQRVGHQYQDLTWYSAFGSFDRASFGRQQSPGQPGHPGLPGHPGHGGPDRFDVDGDGDIDTDDLDDDDLDYGTDS